MLYLCYSSVAASGDPRSSGAGNFSQDSNLPSDSHAKYSGHAALNGSDRKDTFVEKQNRILNATVPVQAVKPKNVQQNSTKLTTTSSAVGMYSSSTDPVHVPSPDPRSSALFRSIRGDVGVVGARCPSSDNSFKQSSVPSSSYANSLIGKDSTSTNSSQSFGPISRNEQFSQSTVTESSIPAMPVSRPFLNNQYDSGPHQQLVGQHKGIYSYNWLLHCGVFLLKLFSLFIYFCNLNPWVEAELKDEIFLDRS